ncbi:hypothetical protein [Pyramidobacter piscolens]|uniref:hypothetical protein n=1 Tax=Pyramidobacter piscolens TaxID=638849 RepID=UPI002AB1E2A9|nr:hypothetical protein [Pyramidobacter piscolens]
MNFGNIVNMAVELSSLRPGQTVTVYARMRTDIANNVQRCWMTTAPNGDGEIIGEFPGGLGIIATGAALREAAERFFGDVKQ